MCWGQDEFGNSPPSVLEICLDSDFAPLVPALAYLIIPWVSEDVVPRANTSLLSAVYSYIFVSNILQQCPKFTVQHLNRRAVLRSITFVPICC